jgi:hypothetical protein
VIRKISISLILLAACAPINKLRTPSRVSEWPITVRRASLAADSGNYINADRILTAYASEYSRTREAHEILFWRALFKLDPGNTSGSIADGLAMLDRYLADTSTIAYKPEATVLKRLAVTTQVLQARAVPTVVRDTTVVKTSNDAEVAALKAELAKANAELERIKKRLANPNK